MLKKVLREGPDRHPCSILHLCRTRQQVACQSIEKHCDANPINALRNSDKFCAYSPGLLSTEILSVRILPQGANSFHIQNKGLVFREGPKSLIIRFESI